MGASATAVVAVAVSGAAAAVPGAVSEAVAGAARRLAFLTTTGGVGVGAAGLVKGTGFAFLAVASAARGGASRVAPAAAWAGLDGDVLAVTGAALAAVSTADLGSFADF